MFTSDSIRAALFGGPQPPNATYVTTSETRSAEAVGARNGVDPQTVRDLNPDVRWPVPTGTQVRVG